MDREAGVSNVAAQHTTGPASDAAIGEAFIDAGSIREATKTAGKARDATVPALVGVSWSEHQQLPR
jgi:hypothetical protein